MSDKDNVFKNGYGYVVKPDTSGYNLEQLEQLMKSIKTAADYEFYKLNKTGVKILLTILKDKIICADVGGDYIEEVIYNLEEGGEDNIPSAVYNRYYGYPNNKKELNNAIIFYHNIVMITRKHLFREEKSYLREQIRNHEIN